MPSAGPPTLSVGSSSVQWLGCHALTVVNLRWTVPCLSPSRRRWLPSHSHDPPLLWPDLKARYFPVFFFSLLAGEGSGRASRQRRLHSSQKLKGSLGFLIAFEWALLTDSSSQLRALQSLRVEGGRADMKGSLAATEEGECGIKTTMCLIREMEKFWHSLYH